MEEKLPDNNELGDDFWNSFTEDRDEAFFSAKAAEIIDTVTDDKYVEILTKAGIVDAEDEAEYKDVDTLADALMMCFSLNDSFKNAKEYYSSLNI